MTALLTGYITGEISLSQNGNGPASGDGEVDSLRAEIGRLRQGDALLEVATGFAVLRPGPDEAGATGHQTASR